MNKKQQCYILVLCSHYFSHVFPEIIALFIPTRSHCELLQLKLRLHQTQFSAPI